MVADISERKKKSLTTTYSTLAFHQRNHYTVAVLLNNINSNRLVILGIYPNPIHLNATIKFSFKSLSAILLQFKQLLQYFVTK